MKVAGCGKSTSIVMMENGLVMMWGKNEFQKVKFDDYKRYSFPYQICQDIQVVNLSVGFDHYLVVDDTNNMWVYGENTNGALGLGDNKNRLTLQPLTFFENKRIIDLCCGDKFSVVICETYNLAPEEESKYFHSLQAKLQNAVGGQRAELQKMYSTKMSIETTRQTIFDQKGVGHIPDDLREKINLMLIKNAQKFGRSLTQKKGKKKTKVSQHAKYNKLQTMVPPEEQTYPDL